jgi:hypothetical protein
VSQILNHPSHRLKTEDCLFEFVISQIKSNRSFVQVLEFIRFEFLTKSAIDDFIKWSFEHFDELEMTISLWESITKRLSGTVNPDCSNSLRYGNQIRRREGFPLVGIISKLTRMHGGNVHERGIINVSASSVVSTNKSYAAQNAVDLDQQNIFYSPNEPNQWLCFDFKDRRIQLTNYSIAAHTSYFLRSWVVEGSDRDQIGQFSTNKGTTQRRIQIIQL